jgi:hypothetical protein
MELEVIASLKRKVGPNATRYSSVQDGCYGVTASVNIMFSPENWWRRYGCSGSKIGDIFSAQSLLRGLFYGLLIFFFCSGTCAASVASLDASGATESATSRKKLTSHQKSLIIDCQFSPCT